jgi:hypothetical protein
MPTLRDDDFCFQLEPRCSRLSQEMPEITKAKPTVAFGNIARNRHRGFSHLEIQDEQLVFGERIYRCVDVIDEIHTLLPREQVAIRLFRHT